MDSFLGLLSFFGSPPGLTTIGAAVALVIVLWEWRIALVGLVLTQVGVAAATVALAETPSDWAGVMVSIMFLCALMLALAALRRAHGAAEHQAGTLGLRGLMVALIYVVWRLADLELPVPAIDPALVELFVWLTLCMLTMLGLSESPLFTVIALLLWLIPAQALAAVLVGAPALMALIGILALLLALGGSYLILVEQAAAEETAPAITDIAFPPELETGRVPRLNRAGVELEPVANSSLPWEVRRWLERPEWIGPLLARWQARIKLPRRRSE